jgi:sporulation protein YlmC with PRC-barrel domain
MIRASDLIGCVVETQSGERLGRVHDLRAEADEGRLTLTGLVIGRGGMLARLTGSGPDPLVSGDTIPWRAIASLSDGLVVVCDGAASDRVRP